MQKPERRKKYKDSEPEKTVEYIKGLLTQFGIEIKESYHHIDTADINSCRIWIANPGLEKLDLGTNGKGMNLAYTKASAYGEFMERLANNFLLPGDDTNIDGIFFMDKEEAAPYVKAYCRDAFGDGETLSDFYLKDFAGSRVCLQKFTDAFSGAEVLLPLSLIEMLTGSNGLCAGNGREEAILQGISEIFERQVHYELVLNNITPPEIDREVFEGTDIYERLKELDTAGYRSRILDLSLGRGLPVIGLILYHGGKYRVRLGSDPSPITALERCFTEIFQGYNRIDDSLFAGIDEQKADRETFDGSDRDYWFTQYNMGINNRNGYFPLSFVLEEGTPDYEFKGFEHPVSESNEDDLAYYMDIIRRSGKKLYIADRSSLGFPAYYTFIPSYSETMLKDDGGRYFRGKLSCALRRSGLKRIHSMNREELLDLADAVEEWFTVYAAAQTGINYLCEYCELERFHKYKLLAYLYACGGDREAAEEYLEAYTETSAWQRDRQLLVRKKVEEGSVEQCFPKDAWPVCPDCEACGMKNKCHLEDIKKLNKHIRAVAGKMQNA